MKVFKKALITGVVCAAMAVPSAFAMNMTPGKGVTLSPARATWDTGFFQEEIVRQGLEELGFKVKKAKDLSNPIAYKSIALGDIDYWTNGWYPNHISQTPKDFDEKAAWVGTIIKAGGLQGYLVSKAAVEKYNIKSLDDFKRPEVKKAFDKNGDGKADLTACPPGWGCENVIAHHMKVYDLTDHINPVKAAYNAGMASAIGAFKSGEPIFFYTWAPNWTTGKLVPGKDVMWINVPKIIPKESQKPMAEYMTGSVPGAVTDPVKLGFVISDIRVAANKKFLAENPAAKKFFEIFKLPAIDVNEQNSRMHNGEKSQKDIEKHASEWIKSHQTTWNAWLSEARKAAM
ncbi:MAG: glycine betaine/L-proline ABC transporter substrate-binding protein ProX [Desulfobacterales bacterium]|nr:glycine betaine/L-proline ABC transporter substrate-binding protein ProX [Desulfobacterales bacterium]